MGKGKKQSRADQWKAAAEDAVEAIRSLRQAKEDFDAALSDLDGSISDLVDLQGEYQDWYDKLPESLLDTPTASLLEEINDLDLDTIAGIASDKNPLDDFPMESLDEAESAIEGITPPRGFGKD